MAIEGPLRELGIHDVFQLLDLSRKTGALRVTSELRDDEGIVYFDRGAVVFAAHSQQSASARRAAAAQAARSREADLARARDAQRATQLARASSASCSWRAARSRSKELERQVRLQIERWCSS